MAAAKNPNLAPRLKFRGRVQYRLACVTSPVTPWPDWPLIDHTHSIPLWTQAQISSGLSAFKILCSTHIIYKDTLPIKTHLQRCPAYGISSAKMPCPLHLIYKHALPITSHLQKCPARYISSTKMPCPINPRVLCQRHITINFFLSPSKHFCSKSGTDN